MKLFTIVHIVQTERKKNKTLFQNRCQYCPFYTVSGPVRQCKRFDEEVCFRDRCQSHLSGIAKVNEPVVTPYNVLQRPTRDKKRMTMDPYINGHPSKLSYTAMVEVDGPARARRDVERSTVRQYNAISSSGSDVIDLQVRAQVVDQRLFTQCTRRRAFFHFCRRPNI